MRRLQLFCLIPVLAVFLFCSCKKDRGNTTSNCEYLKNAIINDSEEEIKALVIDYINQLPSQDYTEQNINALQASMEKGCSIKADMYCFDCVSTLPSMTEIQITVTSVQPNIFKTVDLSYTPNTRMIRFVAVH